MTDNIIQNNKQMDLKKDNGLFDDVWDIGHQDDKKKDIINTSQNIDKSITISDNDWDSLLDYYEPSRKEINKSNQNNQINQINQKSKIDTIKIEKFTNNTKPQNNDSHNIKESIKSKKTKPTINYDNEYDDYNDMYDGTYDDSYDETNDCY